MTRDAVSVSRKCRPDEEYPYSGSSGDPSGPPRHGTVFRSVCLGESVTAFGFQLYSLHGVDDALPTVLDRVGETGFEGVEFAGLGDSAVDDIDTALERNDLAAAGMHVAIGDIEESPPSIAETCRALDTDHLVVPWLEPENFESMDAIESTATRLDTLADTLEDHGITLHYHNHDQEFVTVDHRPALEHLAEATDTVRFQVDLGWVGAAGYDPLSFLDAIGERVDLVHLKDYDAHEGAPAPVGTGHLDIAAAIDSVRDMGVDWLIYEAETAPDSYETLATAQDIAEEYW